LPQNIGSAKSASLLTRFFLEAPQVAELPWFGVMCLKPLKQHTEVTDLLAASQQTS
jgi:hypothetical protein